MSCAKPKRTNSCGTTWNGWSLGLLYKGRAVNKIGCEKSSKWRLQRTTKRTSRLDSNKSEIKKKALRRHRSKNLFFRFFEDENELLQNHRSHKKSCLLHSMNEGGFANVWKTYSNERFQRFSRILWKYSPTFFNSYETI